jgi:hypothetical protein
VGRTANSTTLLPVVEALGQLCEETGTGSARI